MSQTQKRTTHTPGPWTVRPHPGGGYTITVEGGSVSAHVFADDKAEADARLIAAAPGLLAVLEALLDATRAQPWTGVADLDDDWFVSMEQAIDEAK